MTTRICAPKIALQPKNRCGAMDPVRWEWSFFVIRRMHRDIHKVLGTVVAIIEKCALPMGACLKSYRLDQLQYGGHPCPHNGTPYTLREGIKPVHVAQQYTGTTVSNIGQIRSKQYNNPSLLP